MTDSPRYAVLFKTHFWDDFNKRQLQRLCDRAGPGRVYVVVDETRGPVGGIEYPEVVRMTERMAEDAGYLMQPRGNLFWYNTDYQVYHFFDRHPQFDFVFGCEYDCTVFADILPIIEAMAAGGLGFVGEPTGWKPDSYWERLTRPYYPEDHPVTGRLLCCAAFSRSFARHLQAARRDHTKRVQDGAIADIEGVGLPWPNNEALVGAEIARLGTAELPLSAFGGTTHYVWSPPYLEAQLPTLADSVAAHPVLEGQRYLRALQKLCWDLRDIYRPGSYLQQRLSACDPADYVPLFVQHFVAERDWTALEQLRGHAAARGGNEADSYFNVARGKPATQSSTCHWSRWREVARDAAGAVDGRITGGFGFHTDLEQEPWWCVDLEAVYPVREVRIHNRLDEPHRAWSLIVSCSTDLMRWTTLHPPDAHSAFEATPLRLLFATTMPMRFLHLHLPVWQVLHVDEVEIYV
jgi:hypothetical protein